MPPTTIFVPGSWHTHSHAQPLISTLTHRGHRAISLQLVSVGLKSPRPTFADDIDLITQGCAGEIEQGKDVLLVLHSMAGMCGAEAVNRIIAAGGLKERAGKGRLVRVVLIAAQALPAGMVLDAREYVGSENPNLSIDDDDVLHMADPRTLFFNDVESDAEAQTFVNALEPCYCLYRQPVISSEEWRRAPLTYLVCEMDRTVPLDGQEMMSQGMDVVRLALGHSPFVGHPEPVADRLEKLLLQKT